MFFSHVVKRRTSRRNTSKLRPKPSDASLQYGICEKRLPLTSFFVTTELDVVDADDGLLSFREAVTAANTNEAFSDAPAGEETGDRIAFGSSFVSKEVVLTEGELLITDDVIIRGASSIPASDTGITAEGSRIFNVSTSETVRFQGVFLKQGDAELGGLIMAQPGSDVLIDRSTLANGNARQGGAIYIVDGSLRTQRSTFMDNSAIQTDPDSPRFDVQGGAVYAMDSQVTFSSTRFTGNAAVESGGAVSSYGGELRLFSSNFEGNTANNGGAVETLVTQVVSDSNFLRNRSNLTGGAASFSDSTVHLLEGSRFTGNGLIENSDPNAPSHSGGAVYSLSGELFINNVRFEENASDSGGAILAEETEAVFQNLRVENNVAGAFGGGIGLRGGRTWIVDSNISSNTANIAGELGGQGGGVIYGGSPSGTESILVFRRVTVSGNEAADVGGGVYVTSFIGTDARFRLYGSTVEANVANGSGGGGLVNRGADIIIAGSSLIDNVAAGDEGSGGALLSSGQFNRTLVFGSEFSGNAAGNEGGAISMEDGFTRLANSTVSLNESGVRGGAANIEAGRLVFIGGTVEQNRTTADDPLAPGKQGGGAVFVESGAQLYARNGTAFRLNSANTNGGAIQAFGLVNFNEVELRENSANQGGAINAAPFSLVFVRASSLLENSVFEGNGAAILVNSESSLILTGSVIEGNSVINNVQGFPVFKTGGFLLNANNSFTANTPNNDLGVFG